MKKPPLYRSFVYAINGLLVMLRNERNFRIEVFALLVNIFFIFYLKLEKWEAIIIVLFSVLVLSFEIVNTTIEKICDVVQPEYDEKIKVIKDISAAAVLLFAFFSMLIGVSIYWKYFFP